MARPMSIHGDGDGKMPEEITKDKNDEDDDRQCLVMPTCLPFLPWVAAAVIMGRLHGASRPMVPSKTDMDRVVSVSQNAKFPLQS